jgi:hypothetical protein
MSEEKERLVKAYRRASLGLGAAALLWTAAFLLLSRDEPTNTLRHWLIPIGAAALSVLCWSLYTKAKDE